MRDEDLRAVERVVLKLGLPSQGRVLIFSMAAFGDNEKGLVDRILPGWISGFSDRGGWDLSKKSPLDGPRFDLGIACNVFMCARDPMLWLRNISQSIDILIVQDMVDCVRGGGGQIDEGTGDLMRYSFSTDGQRCPWDGAFDMSTLGSRIVEREFYRTEPDPHGLKFACAVDLRDFCPRGAQVP